MQPFEMALAGGVNVTVFLSSTKAWLCIYPWLSPTQHGLSKCVGRLRTVLFEKNNGRSVQTILHQNGSDANENIIV